MMTSCGNLYSDILDTMNHLTHLAQMRSVKSPGWLPILVYHNFGGTFLLVLPLKTLSIKVSAIEIGLFGEHPSD
jgi:hypothetical protein